MAERSIPIEVQLKLVEIPANIAGLLETIGEKLGKVGQVKITPAVPPTEQTRNYAKAMEKLDEKIKDVDGMTREKLLPSFQASARDATGAAISISDVSNQAMRFTTLIGAGSAKARLFNNALEAGQISLKETATGLKVVGRGAEYFNLALDRGEIVLVRSKKTIEALSPEVARLTREYEDSRREIAKHQAALRLTGGQLGATGLAIRRTARDFFWLGLGTMFITMAYSRFQRRGQAITRQMYSLRSAYRGVEKANRAVREAIMEFGYGTEEVRDALERKEDALERVKMAEDNARAAVEQHVYAGLMLFWGTVPTVIRAISDLYTNLMILWSGYMLNKQAAEEEAICLAIGIPFIKLTTASTWGLVSAKLALLAVASALTFGLMAVSFAMSQILIQRQMEQMTAKMKEMRRESGILEEELTGGSLVDSLYKTSDAFRELNRAGKEFTLQPGQLGRIGEGISVRALNIGAIQINATVRREDDIRKIRASLEDLFIRGYYGRGGA